MTEDEELLVLAEQAQHEETIPITIEELKAEVQKKLSNIKTK
ncbi:TPA: hypothetical protein ACJTOE_004610 [Klebsiella aerogenes]